MLLCCIPICRNAKAGADQSVGFHSFPIEKKLRSKWIDFIGVDANKFRWRMKHICSEHFLHSELIEENDKRQLLEGAVPMVFSPDETDEESDSSEKEDIMVSEEPPESFSPVKIPISMSDVELISEAVVKEVELRTLFCRICLKKRPDLLTLSSTLHNVSLTDIIFIVAGLKIDTTGVVPTKICGDCVGKADLAYSVRNEFLHNEKILKNLIKNKQLENHYQSYDVHRFDSRNLNESYLNKLLVSVEPMIVEPKELIKLEKDETAESAAEEEDFLEEHLYDEHELINNDDTTSEKPTSSQESTELASAKINQTIEHENSAHRMKLEEMFDSSDEADSKPKYIYSWKELCKPKRAAKPKRVVPPRPKPTLVPHTCYVCNTAHADADGLDSHIEEHVGLLPFTCEECNRPEYPQVFKTLIRLNYHLQTHLYPFQCDYCPQRFQTNNAYTSHMRIMHEDTNKDGSTCHFCGEYFTLRRAYLIHVAKHQAMEEGKFKCEHCGKKFGTAPLLKRHVRIHTGEKPFECKKCGSRFNHEANFQNHKRVHIGEKAYVCAECGENFINNTFLKYHMAKHFPDDPQYRAVRGKIKRPRYNETVKAARSADGAVKRQFRTTVNNAGQKQFECDFEGCSFVTTSHATKWYHRQMHLKKFHCTICQKRFPTQPILNKHVTEVHEGKKPEKTLCCPHCPKKFNSNQKLQGHVDIHEDNRRYKCQFCEKGFVQKVNCISHERTHTGERPYVCRVCAASFITSSGRKKHEKTHAGIGSLSVTHGLSMEEIEEEILDNEDEEIEMKENEELVKYSAI